MKGLVRIAVVLFALSLVLVAVAAPSVAGKWKGHIVFDKNQIPKNLTPQQTAALTKEIEQVSKMVIVVNFKADKTYTGTLSGGTLKKPQTSSGTWTQSGLMVTATNSQKGGPSKPQQFKLSKNGSTLTATTAPGITIVLHR